MSHTRYQQYQLATDPIFRGIVEAAVMHAATVIATERPETPGHDQRLGLARTFMLPESGNRDEYLTRFVWTAAMDATIQVECIGPDGTVDPSGVQDASIDAVMTDQWDDMAGLGTLVPPAG